LDRIASFGFLFVSSTASAEIVYFEFFEYGAPDWEIENNVWEIGEPTSGPGEAHSLPKCAATILDGNYPYGPDSRLISPVIDLPDVGEGQEILLRFQEWFDYAHSDRGEVQIRTYEDESWSGWTTLKTINRRSAVWHNARVDLTAYAGKRVRIGFFHVDNTEDASGTVHHWERAGWYIDDLWIISQDIPVLSGCDDFELGWGNWYSDRGIWQLGEPTSGPGEAHSGSNCLATILNGNYQCDNIFSSNEYNNDGPYSTLVSPVIDLPWIGEDEEILLRFQEWFDYAHSDRGEVQIRTYEDESWSGWTTLKTINRRSAVWHNARVDLTAYAGKRVRIGFFHVDNTEDASGTVHHWERAGWYIDDLWIISQDIPVLSGCDDFELGWGNWYSDRGIWQLGEPTSGPGEAHSGSNCLATILNGNYQCDNIFSSNEYNNDGPYSTLVSPVIDLPEVVEGEILQFGFWQYFCYASADGGQAQINVYEDKTWSGWTTLVTVSGSMTHWQHKRVDVTDYSGKRLRIGFYHVDNTEDASGTVHHSECSGWYLDDFWFYRTCDSDLDGDGDVDGTDLSVFAEEFGTCTSNCSGDFEPDGDIDEQDLVGFAIGFGKDNCPIFP
jgi:hypothetical protein